LQPAEDFLMKRAKAPVSVAVRVWQGVGASTLAVLACSAPACGGGPATLGGLEVVPPPDASVGNRPDASQGSSGAFSDDGSGFASEDGSTGDGATGMADDGSGSDGSDDGATGSGGDGATGVGAGTEGGAADASSGGSSGGGPGDGSAADASNSMDASSGGSSSGGSSSGGSSSGGSSSGGSSSGGSSSGGSGDGGSGIVDSGAGDGATKVDAGGGAPPDAGTDGGSSSTCGGATCTNAHGPTSCISGVCTPTCITGYANCDGNPNNGCETDTDTDPNHCGSCTTTCASTEPACSGGACGCNLDVSWAVKITVNVSWPATLVLQAAGDGEPGGTSELINIWALFSPAGTPTGLSIATTVEPCNITLPDFASTLGETYGVSFPASLFDHTPTSFLAPVGATLNLGASVPPTSYSMTSGVETLMGMSAPATGTWPATAAGVTQVDMDADGKPGVTALAKQGTIYTDIPTSYNFIDPVRADELYMAIRSDITSLSGSLSTCTAASGATGSVVVTKMDSHILGCHVDAASGGGDCPAGSTVSGAIFVDDNRPVFVINSASFSAKAVSTATCAAVVAAIP
jgi:hypothetical protein